MFPNVSRDSVGLARFPVLLFLRISLDPHSDTFSHPWGDPWDPFPYWVLGHPNSGGRAVRVDLDG